MESEWDWILYKLSYKHNYITFITRHYIQPTNSCARIIDVLKLPETNNTSHPPTSPGVEPS